MTTTHQVSCRFHAGKSALINRLLGRRMVDSAPKPGVTRQVGNE